MEYKFLLTEETDNTLLLTINRPSALNALNAGLIAELGHFFSEGYRAHDFHSVILTGAGEKSFVAGADISEFLGLDSEQATELSRRGQEVFLSIEQFHKPVLAAVNGFALGGGCELAMACHLRIASGNARFGQPEVNLGAIPGYGGTQRLIQYVGKTKAMELMLTGDMISAEEALTLGLVNKVVPYDELIDAGKVMLRTIAAKGPLAVTEIIRCVNAYFEPGENGFLREAQSFGYLGDTEDFKEGAKAFLEKRKVEFQGK